MKLSKTLVRFAAVAGGLSFAVLGTVLARAVFAPGALQTAAVVAAGWVGAAAALWAVLAPPVTRRRAPAGTVMLAALPALAGLSATGWVLGQASGAAAVAPSDLLFWAVAALIVLSGAGVLLLRNILHSAFALLGALIGVAVLYVYLSADFLAVAQVMIYVGGVLVLILFAIMLTNQIGEDPKITNLSAGLPAGLALAAAMASMLLYVALRAPFASAPLPVRSIVAPLGDAFLRDYLLPFEVASVILLGALVGAVVIARKEMKAEAEPPQQ